jgi:2-oxoglutarate/2-oxoacid ferredoxin oxidoreductase subunit beta
MQAGEYLTGLLFVEPGQREFHDLNGTPDAPLNSISYEHLAPGSKGLEKILARYR